MVPRYPPSSLRNGVSPSLYIDHERGDHTKGRRFAETPASDARACSARASTCLEYGLPLCASICLDDAYGAKLPPNQDSNGMNTITPSSDDSSALPRPHPCPSSPPRERPEPEVRLAVRRRPSAVGAFVDRLGGRTVHGRGRGRARQEDGPSRTRTSAMQLPRGIYLAPMVRGSDLAARALARDRGGASLCYSPMLRDREVAAAVAGMALGAAGDPDRLRRDGGGEGARGGAMRAGVRVDKAGRTDPVEETAYLLLQSHQDDAKNLVVQLCGSDPAAVARATTAVLDVYSREHGALPLGNDLNLGCPQESASAEGFGAFLVERDPDAAVACVAAMRCAIDSYISDALRPRLLSAKIRLLNGGVDDTINFVRRLKVAGVDFVAIHCRYRTDKHTGDVD
ncbi:hypothetical protein ACHAWF_018777 [Thalassiosira exigua]